MTLLKEIKRARSKVFRRVFIKRRQQGDGLFESDWLDISTFIKKWGNISNAIDNLRVSRFRFNSVKLTVENNRGRFNPESDSASLWNGYASQQRTLLKIDTGFLQRTQAADLTWTQTEFPTSSQTIFVGLIQGDNFVSDDNDLVLNVKPLSQVFRDYPARNIQGYDDSMTASKFMTLVRDHTDGSGGFIFRPFFQDTTTNWEINSTTNIYTNLNTGTADDVINRNVWEVMERLSEAENYVTYITRDGKFRFRPKNELTTTSQFHFTGRGTFNTEYGHTIKKVQRFGFRQSNFYSRVQIKHRPEDTSTSYEVVEASLTVSSTNNQWNYGHRSLEFENVWIQTSTVANTLAQSLFDDLSALKNEISFSTTFVPHLEILDRIMISYDSTTRGGTESLWDVASWATATSNELVWDDSVGDSIRLIDKEFKIVQMKIDLDRLEANFVCREL